MMQPDGREVEGGETPTTTVVMGDTPIHTSGSDEEFISLVGGWGKFQKLYCFAILGSTQFFAGANTLSMVFLTQEGTRFSACNKGEICTLVPLASKDCSSDYFYGNPASSISTEWDMEGCSKAGMFYSSSFANSLFFLGFLIGVGGFGRLADIIGRRPVLFVSLVLLQTASVGCFLANSFWFFCFCRAASAAGLSGSGLAAYIILSEITGATDRPLVTCFSSVCFCFGGCYIAILGGSSWISSWRVLQLLIALPGFLQFAAFFLKVNIESPRYHASKGDTEKAIEGWLAISAYNRLSSTPSVAPHESSEEFTALSWAITTSVNRTVKPASSTEPSTHRDTIPKVMTVWPLRQWFVASFCLWFTVSLIYYGVVLDMVNLTKKNLENYDVGSMAAVSNRSLAAEGVVSSSLPSSAPVRAPLPNINMPLPVVENPALDDHPAALDDNVAAVKDDPAPPDKNHSDDLKKGPDNGIDEVNEQNNTVVVQSTKDSFDVLPPSVVSMPNSKNSKSKTTAPLTSGHLVKTSDLPPMLVEAGKADYQEGRRDLAVTSFLSFLLEVPAAFMSASLVNWERIGRRGLILGSTFAAGVSCLVAYVMQIVHVNRLVITLMANAGRVSSSAAFLMLYLYSGELFPTSVRSGVVGVMSLWARVAGILAPVVVNTAEKLQPGLPLLVFGVVAILAASMSWRVLPETLGHTMYDSISALQKGWAKAGMTRNLSFCPAIVSKFFCCCFLRNTSDQHSSRAVRGGYYDLDVVADESHVDDGLGIPDTSDDSSNSSVSTLSESDIKSSDHENSKSPGNSTDDSPPPSPPSHTGLGSSRTSPSAEYDQSGSHPHSVFSD